MFIHSEIEIRRECLKSKWCVFKFVLHSISKQVFNIETVLFSVLLVAGGFLFHYDKLYLVLPLFWGVYLLLVLEETFHIWMLVVLEKQDTIKCLQIRGFKIGFLMIIGRLCVRYQGKFTKSELVYVSLAGPLMSLFFSLLLIFGAGLIYLFFDLNTLNVIFVIGMCSLSPILSLIPINHNGFESDGYKIAKFCANKKVTLVQFMQLLSYTVRSVICPLN